LINFIYGLKIILFYKNMANILVFAPHPDDEILGCGGSIIKHVKNKHKVFVCYLSNGEFGSPKYSPKKLFKIRKNEAIMVCEKIGIKKQNIFFLEIPDNQIMDTDTEKMKEIMSLVRKIKPGLVYLPHKNEKSFDHQQAHVLIIRALDMSGSNNFLKKDEKSWWVENVLAYEIWTPLTDYQYGEDISKVIDLKIKTLELYKSQKSIEGNTSDFIGDKASFLSGYRAATSIGEFREVFKVIRIGKIL